MTAPEQPRPTDPLNPRERAMAEVIARQAAIIGRIEERLAPAEERVSAAARGERARVLRLLLDLRNRRVAEGDHVRAACYELAAERVSVSTAEVEEAEAALVPPMDADPTPTEDHRHE